MLTLKHFMDRPGWAAAEHALAKKIGLEIITECQEAAQ